MTALQYRAHSLDTSQLRYPKINIILINLTSSRVNIRQLPLSKLNG